MGLARIRLHRPEPAMPAIDRHISASPLPYCAECGQPYTPFPLPESRLCAPCVYRLLTGGDGQGERRRLLDAALDAAMGNGPGALLRLAEALEALSAIRRGALWEYRGAQVACLHGPAIGMAPPAVSTLAALDGPTFARELRRSRPALARRLAGWTLVMPLRARGSLLGVLAAVEHSESGLRCPGDLPLLAIVAASASAALERRLRDHAHAQLEAALSEARSLARGTVHEIHNTLVAARAALESCAADGAPLRAVGIRHLEQALGMARELARTLDRKGARGSTGPVIERLTGGDELG